MWVLGWLLWTQELKVYILQTKTNQEFKAVAALLGANWKVQNARNWSALVEQLFAKDASVVAQEQS